VYRERAARHRAAVAAHRAPGAVGAAPQPPPDVLVVYGGRCTQSNWRWVDATDSPAYALADAAAAASLAAHRAPYHDCGGTA
jgi:hypothetical protein